MTTICLTMVCAQGLHATKKVCTNVTTVGKNHILSFPHPLSSPYFPSVMEWGGQGHSYVSTLSWRDSRQRVWSTSSRLSRPLVSRDPALSLMLYALLSLHSLLTGHHTVSPHTCFVSGAKHYRVHSSIGSQKLAHGKSIT